MGILLKKEKRMYGVTTIGKLSIIIFIFSISASLADSIWAIYLDSFLHNVSYVGFFSGFFTIIGFLSFFILVPLIEKTNKAWLYTVTLFFYGISYILFAINKSFYWLIVLTAVITILATLRISSFGMIVRDKSKKQSLSKNEGLIYTFMNTAWLIGPLIAGFLAEKSGIKEVFYLSAIFAFISLILFKISKIKDANIKRKADYNILKNFFNFFKNKDRVHCYILSGGISIWWSFVYIYMPLYIIRSGLSERWVGYFLFLVIIPVILFEYKISKIASVIGFKKIFKAGYLILSLVALICFFVSNSWLLMSLIILASIGIAMLEPTTEAYFFHIIKNKDEENEFYTVYNTAIDSGLFIGKVVPAVIVLFLPFKFIFLSLTGFMLMFYFLSIKIKNIKEISKNKK